MHKIIRIRHFIKRFFFESLNKDKKRILYIHGLDSSPEKDRVDLFDDYAIIISPKLNLKENQFENVLKIANSENIEGIVGHSVGGYLAYHIANTMELPYLIFNPAFGDQDSQVHKLIKPDKTSVVKPQMIVVGLKDEEVPVLNQINYLEKHQSKNIDKKVVKIFSVTDMGVMIYLKILN